MRRRFSVVVAVAFLVVLLGGPGKARGWASIDIKQWLQQPRVKLVAVEFYATWCKPCMRAVPKWKEIHDKYRARGLRLIVVSVQDMGSCSAPNWNPDAVVCDEDGILQQQWKADQLPQAFLWSWQGNLLVAHGSVEQVETAVENYFRASPRIVIADPQDAVGDPLEERASKVLRKMVRSEFGRYGKFDIVADEEEKKVLRSLRKEGYQDSYDERMACKLGAEISPNSRLVITHRKGRVKERLVLELFSIEDGCLKAAAKAPIMGGDLEAAVVEATSKLVTSLAGKVVSPGGKTAKVREVETPVATPPAPKKVEAVMLKFRSEPTGATVMSDGQLICKATPCTGILTPGSDVIEISKYNHLPRKRTMTIIKGMDPVLWALESKKASPPPKTVKRSPPVGRTVHIPRPEPQGYPLPYARRPLLKDSGQWEAEWLMTTLSQTATYDGETSEDTTGFGDLITSKTSARYGVSGSWEAGAWLDWIFVCPGDCSFQNGYGLSNRLGVSDWLALRVDLDFPGGDVSTDSSVVRLGTDYRFSLGSSMSMLGSLLYFSNLGFDYNAFFLDAVIRYSLATTFFVAAGFDMSYMGVDETSTLNWGSLSEIGFTIAKFMDIGLGVGYRNSTVTMDYEFGSMDYSISSVALRSRMTFLF